MADPTYKVGDIDGFLAQITGKHRVTTIKDNGCMTCDVEDVKFDQMPAADQKEYRISGMCSACQASVFG